MGTVSNHKPPLSSYMAEFVGQVIKSGVRPAICAILNSCCAGNP
jgi:hypothetical protein